MENMNNGTLDTKVEDATLRFETEKGSRYYEHQDGFWTRVRYDGDVVNGFVYFGSIETQKNWGIDGDKFNPHILARQMAEGTIDGFTPNFKVGNAPFGIKGIQPEDIQYVNGRFIIKKEISADFHIGDNISEVYG